MDMEPEEVFQATVVHRLDGYLARDKSGIRHAVIEALLRERSVTAYHLHSQLGAAYDVSPKQVISMLGVMTSKLGILAARRQSYDQVYTYTLREKYVPVIRKALSKPREYPPVIRVPA